MLLCCRNSSNIAQNILRNGKCMLNFIDDKPATFKEEVKLSWPGDKPEEKMPKCNFKFEKSMIGEETGEARSMVLTDAIEAIECTWVRELEGAEKFSAGELNGYDAIPEEWRNTLIKREYIEEMCRRAAENWTERE